MPTLPSTRAFVVQFAADPRKAHGIGGRVEHLTSGHTTHFDSWARLREFVERCLEERSTDFPPTKERMIP